MATLVSLILVALCIMGASFVGVVFVEGRMGAWVSRNQGLLVSFSSGIFLVVTALLGVELLAEMPVGTALAWVLFGVVFISIIFKFVPGFHHHHDEHHDHAPHTRIEARRIVLGDGLHNIGDGLLLASSFLVSPKFGIAVAISIFVHELVQEVSEFFVLRQAGYSVRRALVINGAVSATLLVGVLLGYVAHTSAAILHGPILGITIGAFLVVVMYDLVPESVRQAKKDNSTARHGSAFATGLLIMVGVGLLFGHGHEEHHEHEEEHHEIHEHEHATHPVIPNVALAPKIFLGYN